MPSPPQPPQLLAEPEKTRINDVIWISKVGSTCTCGCFFAALAGFTGNAGGGSSTFSSKFSFPTLPLVAFFSCFTASTTFLTCISEVNRCQMNEGMFQFTCSSSSKRAANTAATPGLLSLDITWPGKCFNQRWAGEYFNERIRKRISIPPNGHNTSFSNWCWVARCRTSSL